MVGGTVPLNIEKEVRIAALVRHVRAEDAAANGPAVSKVHIREQTAVGNEMLIRFP